MPIDLEGKLLQSVSCSVSLLSDYLRFGFKLMNNNAAIFGESNILSDDNNVLLHIGKGINEHKIGATFYKGSKVDSNVVFVEEYKQSEEIKVKIEIDRTNELQFFVNDKVIYKTQIDYELRERLCLMAWGDSNEYKLIIKDIEIRVR